MDGPDNNDLLQSFNQVSSNAAEKYQYMLDGSGMNDAQKQDVLEALWSMVVAFVDLGFGVHPVQQACGQLEKELDQSANAESDQVKCKKPDLKNTFNDAPEQ